MRRLFIVAIAGASLLLSVSAGAAGDAAAGNYSFRLGSHSAQKPYRFRPLRGRKGEYRLRFSKYRILFYIEKETVRVFNIDTRGDEYK